MNDKSNVSKPMVGLRGRYVAESAVVDNFTTDLRVSVDFVDRTCVDY